MTENFKVENGIGPETTMHIFEFQNPLFNVRLSGNQFRRKNKKTADYGQICLSHLRPKSVSLACAK